MSEDVIATFDEIDPEIMHVLTEKFSWEQHRAQSALEAILARGIRVTIRSAVKECRDPGDDMFLEYAAIAKADLLVAGDKDLLISRLVQGNAHCHTLTVPESRIKALSGPLASAGSGIRASVA